MVLPVFVTPQTPSSFNTGETFRMVVTLEPPGVVVSKRAGTDIGLKARFYRAESALRNQNDTGINKLLVSFDSEIRMEPDIKAARISESGH